MFLGCSTSFCYWPHEIAWSNQNSVFQKCEPVVYARLGLWNDDYGTCTKLLWLVWVHQALRYAKHIEKVLLLTRYETLMSLIGYCIIANQLWCKHIVPQKCSFSRHAKWEPERLRSSIYFTSVPKCMIYLCKYVQYRYLVYFYTTWLI